MKERKVIRLHEKFDVRGLGRNNRILYYKDDNEIIIEKSVARALKSNADGKAEVLTVGNAPRRYPEVFFNSARKDMKFGGDVRTIILKVPSEMYLHCCRQGNITAYLKGLIESEIKK